MLWWLSFVNEGKNAGVCIVEAPDFGDAVVRAHELDINSGGEVRGVSLDHPDAVAEAQKLGLDELIDPDELRSRGYVTERERTEAS